MQAGGSQQDSQPRRCLSSSKCDEMHDGWQEGTHLVADRAEVALLVQLLAVLAAAAEGRAVLQLPLVQRDSA